MFLTHTRFFCILSRLSCGAAVALLPVLPGGCSRGTHPAEAVGFDRVEELTGSHTRIVWLQDAWERNDVFAQRGQLRLMGYDSRDGRGEREILPGPARYSKPMLTPCGQKIVYSNPDEDSVRLVDWEGGEFRELTSGYAMAIWSEPDSGTVWVYVGREKDPDGIVFNLVVRLPLDDPGREQIIWNHAPVVGGEFQLSADGWRAAGIVLHPYLGVANLEEGTSERVGRGCWSGMSPDNRYLMWILDGAHRALTLFDTRHGTRWQVPLAHAPGIGAHEIYHPRWSNHSRFMAMTGPYQVRHGGNNIRGGGDAVELHVGRFSPDYRAIDAWVQVTDNPYANFFPDVWIASGSTNPKDTVIDPAAPLVSGVPVVTEAFAVTARLTETSPVPDPVDILPYTCALVANTYTVVTGGLPHDPILIAHWAIRDGKVLPTAQRNVGHLYALQLRDFQSCVELEGERLVMDVEDMLLPLFYDLNSAP